MVKWTDEQKNVIDHDGGNLLVSAAAGSGKTTVMVERIITLVTQKRVPLSKILVVTFTDAAASSMRIKIVEKLQSIVDTSPGDDRFLRNQLNRIGDAHVSTVHKFCSFILRRYYAMAGIEPGLKIADSIDTTILRGSAMEYILEESFEKKDEGFLALADIYGGRNGDKLTSIIERIYNYAVSRDDRLDFIKTSIDNSIENSNDLNNSIYMDVLLKSAREQIKKAYLTAKEAYDICSGPYGVDGYLNAFTSDVNRYTSLYSASEGSREDILRALEGFSLGRIGKKSKTDIPESVDLLKKIRNSYKNVSHDVFDLLILDDVEGEKQKILEMSKVMHSLYNLVNDFDQRFTLEKQMRGVMDFDDMQRYALKALSNPAVTKEVQSQFEYVFIDEYQDTNSMQEAILTSVCRQNNMFCVGDVKQSIYRFRHTDPQLFLNRRAKSSFDKNDKNRRIDLNKNFRSGSGIVDCVNSIFDNLMTPSFGGVYYALGEELILGAYEPETKEKFPSVSLDIIMQETEDVDTAISQLSKIALQALHVANTIKSQYSKPIFDDGETRPATWKDFTILTRTGKNVHSEIVHVLTQLNIPVFASAGSGILDEMESRWLLSILRLIDNRDRDLDLIAVLHSPICGLTLSELMIIRQNSRGRDLTFFAASINYMEKHNDNISRTIQSLLFKLTDWRKQAAWLPVERLIWQVLDDTGLYDMMDAMTGGNVRQANLELLVERAKALTTTAASGLYGFLKHVDKLKKGGGDSEQAQLITEAADVVQVMTIHGSKGLEFPVVFIMNMERKLKINDMAGGDSILLNGDLGIAPSYYHRKKRARTSNIIRKSIDLLNNKEEISEMLRLLYVAMTRPKRRLYMIGSVTEKRLIGSINSYKMPLIPGMMEDKTSFLDWVAPVIIRHPDARSLRQVTQTNLKVLDLKGNISTNVINSHDISLSGLQETENTQSSTPIFDEYIKECFDWRYPFADSQVLPSKTTATAMVQGRAPGSIIPPEPMVSPKFMGKEKYVTAAMRGTITHEIFQYVDTSMDRSAVENLVQSLEQRGVIAMGDGELINTDHIFEFLQHPIAKRMENSQRILREQPFTLKLGAGDLYDEFSGSSESVLLQGIIDLAFLEEDGWVLIDYKTNYVSETRGADVILAHYMPQLDIYKKALQNLTGIPVKQAGLYLTQIGDVVYA